MPQRYNETERLGILAADTLFTKEFHWIFREQSVVDVGIDALVEKSDAGNPAGKFIALQIKSGVGNFTSTQKGLTYYVSNVHRNYWLGLNIPILLIAYLPDIDECYWEIISSETLRRTETRWKIHIEKSKTLNNSSKPLIEKYLVDFSGADIYSEAYRLEFDTNLPVPMMLLKSSDLCVVNINRMFKQLSDHVKLSHQHNQLLRRRGVTRDSTELKSNLAQQARIITSQAQRLELETLIFSESFSGEYLLLEKYLYSWVQQAGSVPEPLKAPILDMPKKIEQALDGTNEFRDTVAMLKSNQSEYEAALTSLHGSLNALCFEFQSAYGLISTLCASLNSEET